MSAQASESGGLVERYARALFELADESSALETVAGDLRTLAAMIAASADLRRLIRSPVISRADQGAAMDQVLRGAGIGDLTRRFVGVLASNRRLFALSSIINGYLAMLARRRGETGAEVVSAAELSETQVKAISAALKAAVGTEVAITRRVDPQLIGGLIVRVGSRMVDSSLRTKLARLRLAMKGIG